ncbi:transmembrane protein 71 isoform X1 [Trichechus manatus latirostris]|uniref:Transmembrane protein 71 isoform X1 n=1 Tax=Trichechus manatus latirostris TaxID=127582 RepID=A0A2Y9QX83_TRIMA|nr:transmembrane protein 71 isoform X1 [Trichechus manatus latirostris]XP_023583974.1 transmembrane protein 71 isoform X1 [Trichechus manatus latirostris]
MSQLMSTPVASKCSSGSEREHTGELSPTCIFPSFACDFLDGDSSFECCFIDPLTGSHFTCRRSPRLLTNGYYIWTGDSFLCDKDGNVTLSPSQTSVMYKENLVRIFRKKKRIRHSLSSLFSLSASKSWLHGSIFGDVDPSPREDIWLEGLNAYHCNENGVDVSRSLTDDWTLEEPSTESLDASSPSREASPSPREISCDSSSQYQLTASKRFQQKGLDHPKTSLLQEVSFQAILLAACFIFSACARWFPGGMLASVFTCSVMMTLAYVVKSLFLSIASYFKATTCAWFAKI